MTITPGIALTVAFAAVESGCPVLAAKGVLIREAYKDFITSTIHEESDGDTMFRDAVDLVLKEATK